MINVRRSAERHHDRRRKQEIWTTFTAEDRSDTLSTGFGTLERLNEDLLPPGAGFSRHVPRSGELVTYVREGALAYEDSMGRSGIIHAGEFQRMTLSSNIRHSETNASRTDWAHAFQIWLRPTEAGLEPDREQRRFSAAQRRGALCVFASPDARRGSLRIHQDAQLYSAILEPGQHVVHELSLGRRAWLHVVQGTVMLDAEYALATGDGAGFTGERVVSLTASGNSEILLFDVGDVLARLSTGTTEVRRSVLHPDGLLQNNAVAEVQAA